MSVADIAKRFAALGPPAVGHGAPTAASPAVGHGAPQGNAMLRKRRRLLEDDQAGGLAPPRQTPQKRSRAGPSTPRVSEPRPAAGQCGAAPSRQGIATPTSSGLLAPSASEPEVRSSSSGSTCDAAHVCTPDAARCAQCLFARRRLLWMQKHAWLRQFLHEGQWGLGCAICCAAQQSGAWAKGQVHKPQFDTLRKHAASNRHRAALRYCVEHGLAL